MTDDVLPVVLVALTILIPGLVYRAFKGRFLTIVDHTHEKMAILQVAVSGLFLTLLAIPVYLLIGFDPVTPLWLIVSMKELVRFVTEHWLALFFHSFVLPALVAIMTAYVERKGWMADALAAMGLQPMAKNPSPWASAWILHRGVVPMVAITLKNGDIVYGQFGPEASAAVMSGSRDVFLDALYVLDDQTGELVRDEESSGVFIAGDDIRMVVFTDLPLESPEDVEEADEPTNQEAPQEA